MVGCTDILDVREHPCLDTELSSAGEGGRDDLSPEHRAGSDLHVVANLEVSDEAKGLCHGNITPCLEHHHGHRATGESVADDQLRDDVKTDLLVGNSLDDANGDDVDEGDDLKEKVRLCGP